MEINIQHHEVFGASKELCYISPHVKLAVKLVDNQMHIDMFSNVRVSFIHGVQIIQNDISLIVVIDVYSS
jgi:hypothetical protein